MACVSAARAGRNHQRFAAGAEAYHGEATARVAHCVGVDGRVGDGQRDAHTGIEQRVRQPHRIG